MVAWYASCMQNTKRVFLFTMLVLKRADEC
jgi:hypothetical protein